jgi:L-threonylcarbamoyladenylate synthase
MLSISLENFPSRARTLAIEELEAGNPVIAPSDACYGFVADALRPEGVEQVAALKRRRRDRAFLVMVADRAMAERIVVVNDRAAELMERYLPGALTLILPRRPDVEVFGVPRTDMGLRIPAHALSQDLIRALDRPLITTSANLHGETPTYNMAELLRQMPFLEETPIVLLDGGELPPAPPPTIVRVNEDGSLQLLRQGSVVIEGLHMEGA